MPDAEVKEASAFERAYNCLLALLAVVITAAWFVVVEPSLQQAGARADERRPACGCGAGADVPPQVVGGVKIEVLRFCARIEP